LPEALWAGLSRRFGSTALGKGNRRRQRRAEAKRLSFSSARILLPGCANSLINIRLDLVNKLSLYSSQFQVYEFIYKNSILKPRRHNRDTPALISQACSSTRRLIYTNISSEKFMRIQPLINPAHLCSIISLASHF